MKKYTPTIVLGFLALGFAYLTTIFGVDTILSFGDNATISEWVHDWIQEPRNMHFLSGGLVIAVSGLMYLFYHFITFKPKK